MEYDRTARKRRTLKHLKLFVAFILSDQNLFTVSYIYSSNSLYFNLREKESPQKQ